MSSLFKLQKIIDRFLIIIFSFLILLKLFNIISCSQLMSSSMAPAMNKGDLAISKPITASECKYLKPSTSLNANDGDIIVFKIDSQAFPNHFLQEKFIIHRVIVNDIVNQVITTRGDYNEIVCEWEQKIPYQNIYRKHLFTIPWKWHISFLYILITYFTFSFINILVIFYNSYTNKKI